MKNREYNKKSREARLIWEKIGQSIDTPCPLCGQHSKMYIFKYDALACINCNEWLEKACTDPTCSFCARRPETPYEVYWREKESPADAAAIKSWRRDNYTHKENGRLRHEKKDKLRNFVNQGTSCNEV